MNTVEVLNALNAGEETTAEPADTPEVLVQAAEPALVQPAEPALVQPAEVPQDQVTDSVSHSEEKMQKLAVSNFQLQERVRELEELLCEAQKSSMAKLEEKHQMEKANLTNQVAKLRETVQKMGNMLTETHRECEALTDVSLAEAEEKPQKAEETIAQLEVEKANLTNQVKTLRGTVQNLGNMLTETHRECDELTDEYDCEWEAHIILRSVNNEMKETLMHKEELLKKLQMKKDKMKKRLTHITEFMKRSLAKVEEKHQNAMETIAQLEVEKAILKHQVETLQRTVQSMGNMLAETHRECDELTNEYEREQEANSILEAVNDEMKETLMCSLVEVEEKHQNAMETISQLEVEKADLKHQVETLQSTVQSMENMLAGTHRECDELTNDYEREQEANSILEAVNDEMKETVMELEMKNNEMMETLMEKEELLKTPWQKLRSNTSRLFKRRRQKTTS